MTTAESQLTTAGRTRIAFQRGTPDRVPVHCWLGLPLIKQLRPPNKSFLDLFEDCEAAAGSGAEQETGPPRGVGVPERFRRAHDRAPRPRERGENTPVLRLHERDDARDPEPVEPRGLRIGGFGREPLPDGSFRPVSLDV